MMSSCNILIVYKKSPLNKGKDIADVMKKSRTLRTFLSRANTALWFSKSFGLDIHEIIVKEQKTGEAHILKGNGENGKTKGGIDSLGDTDKAKIEQVLFLLDKFCIGDAFYHELTMIADGLTKSYLVKQQRDQLNDICHISPTPGNAKGAQMSFNDLLKERVAEMMSREGGKHWADKPIQVKISGDGARMTRNSSLRRNLGQSVVHDVGSVPSISTLLSLRCLIVKQSESFQ